MQDAKCLDPAFALLIGSVGGHGIKTISHSDNFGTQGYLIASEPMGITAAIHFFVMKMDKIDKLFFFK
jgi:hypothetical protein